MTSDSSIVHPCGVALLKTFNLLNIGSYIAFSYIHSFGCPSLWFSPSPRTIVLVTIVQGIQPVDFVLTVLAN